jgi:pyruvate-formate lyase-activating enzyme
MNLDANPQRRNVERDDTFSLSKSHMDRFMALASAFATDFYSRDVLSRHDSEPFAHCVAAELVDLVGLFGGEKLVTVVPEGLQAAAEPGPVKEATAAVLAGCAAVCIVQRDYLNAVKLAELGISFNAWDRYCQKILITSRSLLADGSDAYAQTEAWLKDRFCEMPFNSAETTKTDIFVCCPIWNSVPIGNLEEGGIEVAMHSPAAQALRTSILDGSYTYCSKLYCAKIVDKDLPLRRDVNVAGVAAEAYPAHVVFSHDPSCNLSCPSCRNHVVTIPKSQQEKLDQPAETYFLPMMRNAKDVKICGSGDPFASIHFRRLLKKYTETQEAAVRRIVLHTNGLLLDERAWIDLGLAGHVSSILFSLDAARGETYAYTRRGGDFARALRNLEFVAGLRRDGAIDTFAMLFVVQGRNFRELPEFVELALAMQADEVMLQAIANWGTYTPEMFAQHDIFSISHPEHAAFLDVLKRPIMRHPVVNAWNLRRFFEPETVGSITAPEVCQR